MNSVTYEVAQLILCDMDKVPWHPLLTETGLSIELFMRSQISKHDPLLLLPVSGTPVLSYINAVKSCVFFCQWMVAKRRVVGIFSKEVKGISKGNLYCCGRIGPSRFDTGFSRSASITHVGEGIAVHMLFVGYDDRTATAAPSFVLIESVS